MNVNLPMKTLSLAIGLAAFVLAVGATATPAEAQSGDRCANYASTMVQQDQRARQMRCRNWNSHSNYNGHYRWCQTRLRWSRFCGQFSGFSKLGSSLRHAAMLMPSQAMWASIGVFPPRAECGLEQL